MADTKKLAEAFIAITLKNADDQATPWFETVSAFDSEQFDNTAFSVVFAQAARKLGSRPVELAQKDLAKLGDGGAEKIPQGWPLSQCGRAALVLKAIATLPDDRHPPLLMELFYRGDNLEKQAVLQSLILLPDPGRFIQLGVEACRAHVQTVFEAVALDNPYPARFFSEMQFNQMVLKALFIGAPIERITDWHARNNSELVRMASDFAGERKAANRTVPADIQKIIDHGRSLQ